MFRSLYWRIAIGFILCIASVLAVQGVVLIWLLDRSDRAGGANLTQAVSDDLTRVLASDPRVDLGAYLRHRYPKPPRAFYAVMRDGQVLPAGDKAPPESAVHTALAAFRKGDLTALPKSWQGEPFFSAPIMVNGDIAGAVAMVPQTWMEQLGSTMVIVGTGLLGAGTLVASLFIFGPVHRRMRDLETAALRLGAGDLTARARSDGGDEVAALARTFNRMADDLAARVQQIAASDQTRRTLLADVSHELMTPLTAIRGYQERLTADAAIRESEERSRYVSIIGDETHRVERIVGDLLDLARLEGGGDVLNLQDVSVEGLFGRVAARHNSEALDRQIALSTTIEPGAEIVYSDQFRIEQALQNLAANALRHTPAGGAVQLRAELQDREIVLSVHDTGSGMAPNHLPFVFDRFYKADPSRPNDAVGSGLGLSIVKAIIERHGGTVAVQSEPGRGTTFTIRLPAGVPVALPANA